MHKLYIDVGNTNIVLAFKENDQFSVFRVVTNANKTSDEYYYIFKEFIANRVINSVVISSVVPSITGILKRMTMKYLQVRPVVVGENTKIGIAITTDNPREVGSDIICTAVGAKKYNKSEYLVVDLGTANKYIHVKDNNIKGVIITPGVVTSLKALSANTALLPEIGIQIPKKVLGTNTVECIRSGVTYGIAGEVDGLINRIKKEVGNDDLFVVATGGLSKLIIPLCYEDITINPGLIFEGLEEISSFSKL